MAVATRKQRWWRRIGAVTTVSGLLIVTACGATAGSDATAGTATSTSTQSMDHSHHGGGAGTTQMGGLATISDTAFLEMMVPHHQMAVQMADIELRRGSDPAVLALARAIKTAQGPEISRMKAMYRARTGTDLVPAVMSADDMAAMGMGMDMGRLEQSADPDRTFLQQMIPHHAGAIIMSDLVVNRSTNADLVALATAIVAAQAAEIGRMQSMLATR